MQLNDYLLNIQEPPITEVKSWLAGMELSDDRAMIDCSQAVPNYSPSDGMVAYLKDRISDPAASRYTIDEGLLSVRHSVSRWYGRHYGVAPDSQEICLTIGASQAFWLAILSICRAGDEVILTSPCYFDHAMALQILGVRPVWVKSDDSQIGQPNIQAFADRISDHTRAILLVTPNNPTGITISPSVIRGMFDLASQFNLALIIDETYNAFLPTGESPHDLFSSSDWQQTFIHIASFGKTFALTGYRAGALIANRNLVHQAIKIQDTMAVCQPYITQLAIQYGCDNLDKWVAQKAALMQQRHALFLDKWERAGLCFKRVSSGGFFAWIKHPWTHLDSREAARRLLENASLFCLPGEAFGPDLKDYLRLAFGNLTTDDIKQVVERLQAF